MMTKENELFDEEFWSEKKVLITGGTGSFGVAFLHECMMMIDNLAEVRVFSRDEKKQDDLRKMFPHEKVRFIIGDVRDRESVDKAMIGVDYVFHAAALKHVPTGENHPYETVKTNVIGSHNVIESAIANKVKKVVVLSTDKAVNPTCAMGMTKGLMEKCALARCEDSETDICVTRFGNVMGSRNSVIPLFAEQIRSGKVATITNPDMVRYMMTMSQAQRQVVFAFEHGRTGDTIVLDTPAADVMTVFRAVWKIVRPFDDLEAAKTPYIVIGNRRGEKMIESLVTDEEREYALPINTRFGSVYCIPYHRNLQQFAFPDKPKMLTVEQLKTLILETGVL